MFSKRFRAIRRKGYRANSSSGAESGSMIPASLRARVRAMTQHTSKSGIAYYRLLKDDPTPVGCLDYVIREIKRDSNRLAGNHFIAARKDEDAEKIVANDYQIPHSICALVRNAKTGQPIRRPASRIRHLHRG